LLDFFKKYLIKADGFYNNQQASIDWFILLPFFALLEEHERISKPVFYSVLIKRNLVYVAAIVTPISCQHFPRKKNNYSSKPRMAIGRMNFFRLE
jgi:hypothetical protein